MLEGNLQRQTQKHWAAEGVSVFDAFGEKQAADKPALIGSYGEKNTREDIFTMFTSKERLKLNIKKEKSPL